MNGVRRLCNCNLKVLYGTSVSKKSFINIFKPSSRQETFGTVWADCLSLIGIRVENSVNNSKVVCNICGRKIKNLCELFSFVSNGFGGKENGLVAQASNEKRKVSALTPEKSSPANRKCRRNGSPLTKRAEGRVNAAKKSLPYSRNQNVNTREKQLNDIDDLDTTKSSALKVVIAYPNGQVIVKHSFDENALIIIRGICLSQWQTVVNAFLHHAFLLTELLGALEREVNRECKNYCKSDSCLKSKKPDQLSVFANVNVCR